MANGNFKTRVVTANSIGVSCNHPLSIYAQKTQRNGELKVGALPIQKQGTYRHLKFIVEPTHVFLRLLVLRRVMLCKGQM